MERLRKLNVEENLNWVHALPRVVNALHDTPGESGLSPYQILFGRERPLARLPYKPVRECEDAISFFDRQRQVDKKVAEVLNMEHKKRQERINRSRPHLTPFEIGTHVWCLRPEDSGTKLDSRWVGPAEIIGREGADSYVLQMKGGSTQAVPRKFIKEYIEDTQLGTSIPLHIHRRTEVEADVAPDEWEVEEIIKHKKGKDGVLQFLTWWKGSSRECATWEPPNHFFHRYAFPLIDYCRKNKISMDIIRHLSPTPTPTDE
jgi:hypothetical protein